MSSSPEGTRARGHGTMDTERGGGGQGSTPCRNVGFGLLRRCNSCPLTDALVSLLEGVSRTPGGASALMKGRENSCDHRALFPPPSFSIIDKKSTSEVYMYAHPEQQSKTENTLPEILHCFFIRPSLMAGNIHDAPGQLRIAPTYCAREIARYFSAITPSDVEETVRDSQKRVTSLSPPARFYRASSRAGRQETNRKRSHGFSARAVRGTKSPSPQQTSGKGGTLPPES